MKFNKEDLGDNKLKYTVKVDKETLKQARDKAIKALGKDAKIAGFRKGHVPLDVLERSIDPARLSSMEIDGVINEQVIELLETEDLQLLDQPHINVIKYVPSDTLEFTVEIETVPPVKLGDPKELKVKQSEIKVEDEQVDEVIKRLQTSASERSAVEREAENGDEVIIDFTGLKDGEEFAGGKATDYPLELGSGSFIPGFEEGIVGHKSGEEFDVNVTFPAEYGAKDLAGKDAVFKIKLKKVNELKLPELNDDFAVSVAPDLKTMDDLRADIRKELEHQQEANIREEYHNELLEKLAEKSKVDVPKVLIDDQMPTTRKQFEENLMYHGMDLESYLKQLGKTIDEWEQDDLRNSVEKRIRNSMVLRQFIRDYDVKVTEQDIDEYQEKILARYNNPKMKENFQTPEARTNIRQQLLTERAFAKLAELNEAK